ncbi:senescence-specific cysteine protease SAG12-like [Chenopodium quinoa]|uniref:senescence-specific cysteine protease SAG12-like n=1 Tax=Chenopodium quinoa TaxID=63459 RepID=UPI000B784D43|nr:senescence-specific cysteine protease SAG12-like [Chenopodium quinoa]
MAIVSQFCLTLLVFSFGIVLASSRLLNDEPSMIEEHEKWMNFHGRVYKDDVEKSKRFKIFNKNVKRIEASNKLNRGFTLGVNAFADLTNEEFRASRTGYKKQSKHFYLKSKSKSFKYENLTNSVSSTMDWRKKGAVTPIKNQEDCGCCWAFSAVASMEGLNQIKTGKLVSLSEQELVDCDTSFDEGCEGGLLDTAFEFIKSHGGLTTEAKYPYMGTDGTCNAKRAAIKSVSIHGHEDVPENNEDALLAAVAHQPVSVGIEGGGFDFQFYAGGVFKGECGTELDHAVAVIGYGVEEKDGSKYWLVKNSWGKEWGEKGYMRIKRGGGAKEGLCGIAMKPSYPI